MNLTFDAALTMSWERLELLHQAALRKQARMELRQLHGMAGAFGTLENQAAFSELQRALVRLASVGLKTAEES